MSPSVDLSRSAHRPWPLPVRPWALRMTWLDLAFLHWPVDAQSLRERIPAPLELDTFDGEAWIGIVPFRMQGVRPRAVPALPWFSAFPEINLRTYVRHGDKPGVWFFSLDVTNPFAVSVARRLFHLPYFRARMACERDSSGAIAYASERRHRGAPGASFRARYFPTGPVYRSDPGSLEAWLTERYALYSADARGRVYRGDVHHEPWPLKRCEIEIEHNAFTEQIGLPAPTGGPLAHYAEHLEVVAWSLERLGS